MISETEYIITAFKKNFGNFRHKKIVIYGIGKNTNVILNHFSEFNIVGLMDEIRTGEYIYGKKIISEADVLKVKTEAIIIIASAANVEIIFRRIATFCKKNHIFVFDINGKQMKNNVIINFEFNDDKYSNITIEKLKAKILNADTVSFDIFDTLLMRRTLYPRDIFRIVETVCGKIGFTDARIRAEMDLHSDGHIANIFEIYESLKNILKISNAEKKLLFEMELATEEKYIVPRNEMLKILEYSKNKEIYFVSDMYFPKEILSIILKKKGIAIGVENILVSCDYRLTKSNGLFNILKQKSKGSNILHIGDNEEADRLASKKYGIEDTFLIHRADVMLADSYCAEMLRFDHTFANRMIIGEFIAKQLNDPFVFYKTKGKFFIENDYDIGYSFLAPIIYTFLTWMSNKAKELKLEYIFFGARDGWLLEIINKIIIKQLDYGSSSAAIAKYFYISRAVALIAGITEDEDILHVAQIGYCGSCLEILKGRFLLKDEEIFLQEEGESGDAYILRHRQAILKNARIMRKNYYLYLKELNINSDAKIGFVDFVSGGSCQWGLSKITNYDLHGLYFIRLFDDFKQKRELNIESLFGTDYKYSNREEHSLGNNYIFFENILTSFEPSLKSFDENGKPIFYEEYRTENQLNSIRSIHQGIIEYASNYNLSVFEEVDKKLVDLIFSAVFETYSVIFTECFVKNGSFRDEFTNRNFAFDNF